MRIDSAVLYTEDIDTAIDFYQNRLGLTLDYRQGTKFASFLFDNGPRLAVKMASNPREVPGHQTVFIEASDIDTLYQEMKQAAFVFCKDLVVEPWGAEFAIADPDGNKLTFIKR